MKEPSMSDLKVTCPACDSYSSSVGIGFRDEGKCPFCGLPVEAFVALEKARARGAKDSIVKMSAEAEARAARAEAEVGRLKGLLSEIRWTVERAEKGEA
jgi:hypothetical protein